MYFEKERNDIVACFDRIKLHREKTSALISKFWKYKNDMMFFDQQLQFMFFILSGTLYILQCPRWSLYGRHV